VPTRGIVKWDDRAIWDTDNRDGVCTVEDQDNIREIVHYPLGGGGRVIIRETDPVFDGAKLVNFALACHHTQVLLVAQTGRVVSLIHKPFTGPARIVLREGAELTRTAAADPVRAPEYVKRFYSLRFFGDRAIAHLALGPNPNSETGIMQAVLEVKLAQPGSPLSTLVMTRLPGGPLTFGAEGPLEFLGSYCATTESLIAHTQRRSLLKFEIGLLRVTDPKAPGPIQYNGQLFGIGFFCAEDKVYVSHKAANNVYKLDILAGRGPAKTIELNQLGIPDPDERQTLLAATGDGRVIGFHRERLMEFREGQPPKPLVTGSQPRSIGLSASHAYIEQAVSGNTGLAVDMNPKLLTTLVYGTAGERVRVQCTDCPVWLGNPVVRREGKALETKIEERNGVQTTVSFLFPNDPDALKASWDLSVGGETGVRLPLQVAAAAPKTPAAVVTKLFVPGFAGDEILTVAAPGSQLIVEGENLTAEPKFAATPPWGTTLGNCRVLVDGVAVPIGHVSGEGTRSRLRIQLPRMLAPGFHQLTVERLKADGTIDVRSNMVQFSAAPQVPRLFGAPDLTRAGGAVVSAAAPAFGGERLTALGTGFGATEPFVADGAVAAETAIVAATVGIWVKLFAGGEEQYIAAEEVVARVSREEPGVYELEFSVPQLPVIGNATGTPNASLILKVGDEFAPEMPLYVR
jgi:uncharacterized protein (TIGR03437 family)